jgi:hypothetical protein
MGVCSKVDFNEYSAPDTVVVETASVNESETKTKETDE